MTHRTDHSDLLREILKPLILVTLFVAIAFSIAIGWFAISGCMALNCAGYYRLLDLQIYIELAIVAFILVCVGLYVSLPSLPKGDVRPPLRT
jgi:hypothetical protein